MNNRSCMIMLHSIIISCYGMELSFQNILDKGFQGPRYFLAKLSNEHHLLEKPLISSLPHFPTDIVQKIAFFLPDVTSMSNFACCNSRINQGLNSSPHWAQHWHYEGNRAPLKIMKEYINHNEALIKDLVSSDAVKLKKMTPELYFKHPLADPHYFRIKKEYQSKTLVEINSSLREFLKNSVFHLLWLLGDTKVVFTESMLDIIIAQAEDLACIRFLLQTYKSNWDDQNYLSDSLCSLILTFCAQNYFGSQNVHAGNINRCCQIITILLDHNLNMHTAREFPYLNLIAFCDNAHLLLPFFLKLKFDPNTKDVKGKTPLMILAEESYAFLDDPDQDARMRFSIKESIRLLIEAKADPTIQDDNGKTFAHYLCKDFHDDVQKILENNNYTWDECINKK